MERLWNSNYMKVMTANFSLFFAFYVLSPLLPLYLSETFHATKDVIGLILSGYTITTLLVRPFSGYIVDTFNRKTVLMVCFAAFSIFFCSAFVICVFSLREIKKAAISLHCCEEMTVTLPVLSVFAAATVPAAG